MYCNASPWLIKQNSCLFTLETALLLYSFWRTVIENLYLGRLTTLSRASHHNFLIISPVLFCVHSAQLL